MPGLRHWPVAVGSSILAVGLVVVAVGVAPVRHQLALSLVRQPQRYTELALADPLQLPVAEPGGSRVAFQFDVTAHAERTTETSYTVAVEVAGTPPVLRRGAVASPNNVRVAVEASFVAPPAGAAYTVVVTLPGTGQHVDFHGRTT